MLASPGRSSSHAGARERASNASPSPLRGEATPAARQPIAIEPAQTTLREQHRGRLYASTLCAKSL